MGQVGAVAPPHHALQSSSLLDASHKRMKLTGHVLAQRASQPFQEGGRCSARVPCKGIVRLREAVRGVCP